MTKKDIVKSISENTGVSMTEVNTIIDNFFDQLKGVLLSNKELYIRNFGKFYNKKVAAKFGRNLFKNTPLRIDAHLKPVLDFSKSIKKEIQDIKLRSK